MPRLDLEDIAGPACRLVAATASASSVTLYCCCPFQPGSPRLCALFPPRGPSQHSGAFAAAAALWDCDDLRMGNDDIGDCDQDSAKNDGCGVCAKLMMEHLEPDYSRRLMAAAKDCNWDVGEMGFNFGTAENAPAGSWVRYKWQQT